MSEPMDPLENALADPKRRAVLEIVAREMDRLFELYSDYTSEHEACRKNHRWNTFGSFARRTLKHGMRHAEEVAPERLRA